MLTDPLDFVADRPDTSLILPPVFTVLLPELSETRAPMLPVAVLPPISCKPPLTSLPLPVLSIILPDAPDELFPVKNVRDPEMPVSPESRLDKYILPVVFVLLDPE